MALEHAAVRDALIEETLRLMETGGLEAVKARPLADAAGISVGTIYNLFGSVDQLILAANLRTYEHLNSLGRSAMVEIEARLRARIAEGALADTPRSRCLARLLGLAETYVDFVSDNAARWSALLAFNRLRGEAARADSVEQLSALMGIIAGVLEDVPIWRSSRDRRLAARALWSAVHGIIVTNYVGTDRVAARAATMDLIRLLVTTLVDGMYGTTHGREAREVDYITTAR